MASLPLGVWIAAIVALVVLGLLMLLPLAAVLCSVVWLAGRKV